MFILLKDGDEIKMLVGYTKCKKKSIGIRHIKYLLKRFYVKGYKDFTIG